MAGQEFKATEKSVLKNTRDGAVEKNLVSNTAERVSKRTEDAVLKKEVSPEHKAAGIEKPTIPHRQFKNLQFGRNNPDKLRSDDERDNQQSEQTVMAFAPVVSINFAPKEVPDRDYTTRALRSRRKAQTKADIAEQMANQPEKVVAEVVDVDTISEGTTFDDNVEIVDAEIIDEVIDSDTKLSFKSEDEYVNSEESVEIDGAEFVGQKAEEKAESKLKEKKTRNGLKQKSSAAEKLTDKDGNPVLCFDVIATPDRKLTHGEKKLKRRIRKDEKRVFKLQKRLDKAEDNLPHQRVFHVRKEWNSEKQKMQRKLRLEKEVKPLLKPNIVQNGVHGAKHAVTTTVSGIAHQQISKYEDDNQTLKAAHGTEKVAESALRFTSNKVKSTNQKLKEKPYKKASKLKFDSENAHKKLNQHKVTLEHKTEQQTKKEAKKEAKKALKKSQQKINQKNAAKTAKKGASKVGKKAGEAAKDVGQIIVKAVANNKVVIIILIIFLLLFGLLFTLGSSAFTSLGDTGTMVIASSYTSDEEDIYAANDYMNALENNLNYEISNIPNVYVGWNEYNYYIDPIGHDPYALISYLTAMEINFDYDADTQARIQELFNALYTLEVESVHEVRSYQYTTTDEEGNEVIVTVYYDYYILNVTLTANDWDSVVIPKLRAAGVYEVYQLLQETQGNKPDLF